MRGVVNDRLEAIIPIRVRGPGGIEIDVDAIVDSGFSSSLTLPGETIATLGLNPPVGRQRGAGRWIDPSIRPVYRRDQLGRHLGLDPDFGGGRRNAARDAIA